MKEKERKKERRKEIFLRFEKQRRAHLAIELERKKVLLGLSARVSNLHQTLTTNLPDELQTAFLVHNKITQKVAVAEKRYYYQQGFLDGARFTKEFSAPVCLPSTLELEGGRV